MLWNPMLMKLATPSSLIGFQMEYKGTATGGTGTTTYTMSSASFGTEQSDREIFALVAYNSSGGGLLTSATIGGLAATIELFSAVNTSLFVYVIRAVVPTGATGNIVVNSTATTSGFRIFAYRVSGRTNVGSAAVGTGSNFRTSSGTSLTLTGMTIPADGFALTCLFYISSLGTVSVSGLGAAIDASPLEVAASVPFGSAQSGDVAWTWTTARTGVLTGFWSFN